MFNDIPIWEYVKQPVLDLDVFNPCRANAIDEWLSVHGDVDRTVGQILAQSQFTDLRES
jgi:hypothetical protein